jgi:hypothetical protein
MMKHLLFSAMLLIGGKAISQSTCSNLDFEAGNLGGWMVTSGQNTLSTGMGGCCPTAGSAEATVVATPLVDPNMGTIPNSPLGGTQVAKLNDASPSGLVTRLTYSLVVTSFNAVLPYAVAGLSQGSGHACGDQPYFNMQARDMLNNIISTNHMEPGVGCTGSSVFTNTTSTYSYFGWTTFSVNLTAYIGQTVTINFTTGDCDGWGHYGYSYFDVACAGVLNVKETASMTNVNVWPNPAKDVLNVETDAIHKDNSEIAVYDVVGKQVMKKDISSENVISIQNLIPGVYMYNVSMNGKIIKSGKLVKE